MTGHCEGCGTLSDNLEHYQGTVPNLDLCPSCVAKNRAALPPKTGAEQRPPERNQPHTLRGVD